MTRIAVFVAARDDRRAITAYTVERFGIHQARRVRATFERVLNTLADTPMIGRPCDELDPPGRSFRYFVMMKLLRHRVRTDLNRNPRRPHPARMRRLAAELDRDPGDDG